MRLPFVLIVASRHPLPSTDYATAILHFFFSFLYSFSVCFFAPRWTVVVRNNYRKHRFVHYTCRQTLNTMAESKCCFGCTNSRNCAWVISIFNMFICVLLVLPILQNLSFISYTHSSVQRPQDLISNNFFIFNLLCMLFLLFYINLSLNKATYTRNVQSVHHWLVTMWIFFIFFILYICFAAFVNRFLHLITIGIPVSTVVAYQIHVVKTYYDAELEFVAAAVVDGRNRGFVVGPSPLQSVVASSAAAALFPVQPGAPPYVIHEQQPSSAYPAIQSMYQYPQHQFPQSHVVQVERSDLHEPSRDSGNSQPSYSPAVTNFNNGPSIKH